MSRVDQLADSVRAARLKLAGDLEQLRSPDTLDGFARDIGEEAGDLADAVVDKTKAAALSAGRGLIDELKIRAAANPGAALLIGAGALWHLTRHPPVTATLIGAGVIGLMRADTAPVRDHAGDEAAYAKRRAVEQASGIARDVGEAVHAFADKAVDRAGEAVRAAGEEATVAGRMARQEVDRWVDAGREVLEDRSERDKLLLGLASVAVAAALGLALNSRVRDGRPLIT